MDDGSPSLEVGFAIDAAGSFDVLTRLASVMDSTEAKIVKDAAAIERATGGMMNISGATAAITTFGNSATRELRDAAREMSRVEKSGEAMVRQLERQNAAFGKTREELRSMKAEEAALAADRVGNADLATRIRTAELAIYEKEFAAARRMRLEVEAAAEAKVVAANQAVAAAEREAQAVRSAALAHQMFEAAARRGIAVFREQQVVEAAAAREAEALVSAATRLRAAVDPAFASQQRFNREMGEARILMAAGVISLDDYCAKLRIERAALDGVNTAQSRNVAGMGAHRSAMQGLSFQAQDTFTQLSMGTNIFSVLAIQGGQAAGQFAMLEGRLGSVASFLIGPWGLAITAAMLVLGALTKDMNLFGDASEKGKDKTLGVVDALTKAKFATNEAKMALVDYNKEKQRAIESDSRAPALILAGVQARLKDALAIREQIAAQIEKTLVDAGGAQYLGGGALVGAAAVMQGYLTAMKGDIATLRQALRNADVDLAKDAARAATDPIEAIRQKYRLLSDTAIAAAHSNDRLAASLTGTLTGFSRQEAAAIKAAQASANSAREYGRVVSSAQASAIARAAGFQVNSADRSFASQKALYDRWAAAGRPANNPVAKPGSSAHEFGNALDIQKSAGLTVEKIKGAFAAEGVRLTKVFSEQGHWHVEWQRAAEDVRAVSDAHREGTKAAREQEQVEKSLGALLSKGPAAAWSPSDSIEAQRRAAAESKRAFKDMFGDDDPLADIVQRGTDALAAQWDARDAATAERQKELQDQLRLTADLAESAGDAMSRSFGRAGEAIGEVLRTLGRYGEERKRIADAVATSEISARNGAQRTASLQVGAYGDMVSAAKGFVKEGSDGYKALEAAEKVYRVAQLAMSLQAMVQSVIETTTHVASAAARATADGAAGIAAQSKLPFPANIAAMAATAAALVAAGIAVFGGGGSKAAAPVTNTGTGTVLGDGSAKSDSIKNAIDALKEVDTLTNTFAREMSVSLRSIDSQIGGLAALVVRTGDINASAGVTEGFKANAIGSILSKIPLIGGILGGLFGSKTSVIGSGLYGGAQSVGSILGGGFDASYYSDVQKKSKFLGITTGTKNSTQLTGADAGLESQFTLILRGFNDAITAAAGPLGAATADIQARLNGFVVNIGKIDLQGLTGTEIQEKLTAVFGAAADSMANAAFPGFTRFQKVGEGAFETLVRVASTVEAVTAALDQLGAGSRALGIDAKLGLADQFDSVSDLTSAVDGYFQVFYTKEEQAAAKAAQFGQVFDSLGLTMPATLAGFRQLAEAQNLNTAAGQATYATLLQLAPAFADLKSSMDGAKSAADIMSERQDLQRKLLELNGDTAAIRALDLAKLDASNRALQQQVWAVQDAQEAASAAKQLQEAWTSIGDSIMNEVKRIRGLTGTGGEGGFASLMGQFNAANTAARAGDQDAAKSLPGLSQALLKAAADAATSRQELDRVQAQTAASLEATYGVIGKLTGSAATNTGSTLSAAATATQATSTPAANDDRADEARTLREEIATMRAEMVAGLAVVAGHTGRTARKLDDVTTASGGDAISVAAA